ncbi:MAG: lamin tail domain-containing protein [Candidatus Marinimicrobia bacterium]|nr:lamin tail domain-containing protein [Candidatus Neomarinimicrobiota bacterium]
MKRLLLVTLFAALAMSAMGQTTLFFSEYIEGSSSNKAIEIYNGTGSDVDLAGYAVLRLNNGATTGQDSTVLSGTLLAGDVYVIGNSSAVAEILDESDSLGTATYYNGDDFMALAYDANSDGAFDAATEAIDVIGILGNDPGTAWDVAGVVGATAEHTLIRKTAITAGNTDWAASAGTTAEDSEWMVFDQNYFGSIGSHPYVETYPVTLSVDMSFQTTLGNFVPATDLLDVAGTLNEWGGGDMLTDDDADGIYTGTFNVAAGAMEYKFRINSNWDTSESLPANRAYTVVAGDNVIPTVWYSDQEPVGATNVEVFIQVDMTVQLLNGNYDPGAGDLIVIRGDHDNFGNWGGATLMTLDPEQTNVYTHLSSFDNVPIGSGFEYKFVILTGGDVDAAIWEGSPNRIFTATGEEADSDENGYGEILQPVAYFADVTPDDIITQDVTVTFNLDISSAYRALANGDTLIDTQTGSDDITAWDQVVGVNINGVLSQWWDWGIDPTSVGAWAMTETAEGSMIYTFEYLYTAGQAKAQQCKYGINSLDNEAGFAQNRDFMIDDVAATYTVPAHCFGEQNSDPLLPFPQLCGPIVGLFFSEYIEGAVGSNKAVEIYNGTGADVDLSAYSVQGTNNGTTWGDNGERDVALSGILLAGDVYVIAADEADAAILAVADLALAYESPVHHNGDDGIALLKNGSIIDMIGVDGVDPGAGWAVAGVADATKDHTLIRKASVTGGNHWNNSAGTNAEDSEWIVMDAEFFGSLGSHPYVAGNPVTFSVDMSFQTTLGNFIPGTDAVDVAGTLNEWGGGDMLTDDDSDGIYVGTFNVPAGDMEYKFRINSNWDTSEGIDNRMYTVVAGANVLPTVWYGNQEPSPPTDVEVFIQVDMTVQLLNGNYDPGAGDLIVIRGGHDNFGNWGGATLMTLDPEQTNIYTHLSSFDNVPTGSGFEYKFVILTGGDVDAAIWEGSPNRSFTATGLEEDTDANGYGEIMQPVAYFADVTPDDIITQDVTVTFNIDITSAYRALANGDTLIDTQTGSDGIANWSEVNGIAINGVLSQWWDWGNDITCVGEWAMTQTDADGFLYTFDYLYTAGQAKAQQCKYGINSLDNEAGFAQNRDFMIDDANPTYVLATHCFGEQNTDEALPLPQVCGPVSIASLPGIPTSYALSQNYPNPFNPTTTINIALPEANNVVLTIYNALGQEVRTLKTDYLNAGNYSVTWDGLDNAGNSISSGLYIYTMTAGNQNFSKKMLMLK